MSLPAAKYLVFDYYYPESDILEYVNETRTLDNMGNLVTELNPRVDIFKKPDCYTITFRVSAGTIYSDFLTNGIDGALVAQAMNWIKENASAGETS